MINDIIFQNNYDGVLLRCLEKDYVQRVLKELHDRPVGDHYIVETTTHKIILDGYYWPTLFKDCHAYARNFKTYQTTTRIEIKTIIPLKPITINRPFQPWGLDIISEIT